MNWQDLPTAPALGTVVCGSGEVSGLCTRDLGGFPLLLIRDAAGLRGFVNICPHQYLPLDFKGGGVLSADGARLICSTHQAMFDSRSGGVLAGPANCDLMPVPLAEENGKIIIAGHQPHP